MAANNAYRWAKRIVITVVGFTVLLAGIIMIVLPGPAFVVIPIGLGILGLEFAWARLWLRKVKEKGQELARSARSAMGSQNSRPAGGNTPPAKTDAEKG
jgi:tellurite resistance protein TerC